MTIHDGPIAQFTINEEPITFVFDPVDAGTPCGLCGAEAIGSNGANAASLKAGEHGTVCPECTREAMPGLDRIVQGLDYLLVGLLEIRESDQLLAYEAIAGQLAHNVRAVAAIIGSLPLEDDQP